MKIESSPKPLVSEPGRIRTNAAKTGAGAARPAAPESDVALSSLSSQLQKIEGTQAGSPPVDVERVAEIRQAIAQGNFKIDAGKIADGLIESVRQMLAAQKQ
ncbi:MAG: flagellar biosynthesis anti-sigma factor FlgM [Sterolibacterium sp.]|nr:flagellar biosynthesis anti-sigma factor FlgM [Sterolibacterium sp.]